jgi:hypothetical protein
MIDVSNISTTSELQKKFDKFGPETYQFAKNQRIAVNERMSVSGSYKLFGNLIYAQMPVFKLNANVSEADFGEQEAIIDITGKNASVGGIRFDGNDTQQKFERGDGFHNFIHLINTTGFSSDLLYVENSLGDGIRAKNANDTDITRFRVSNCGHDGIFIEDSKNVSVSNSIFYIRTNCGTRFRACKEAQFFNNWVENKIHTGISTGPGVQLENSKTSTTAKGYDVFNNYFKNTDGPGIWVIGTYAQATDAASDLNIYQNTYEGCGQGGHYKNCSSTGAICIDGWNGVITQNLFTACRSGVTVGPWIGIKPAGSGYKVQVKNNMFVGCVAGKQIYSTAGTAIDKTSKVPTSVVCSNNMFYKNKKDYYANGTTTQVDPKLYLDGSLYMIGSNSGAYNKGIGAGNILNTYESVEEGDHKETDNNNNSESETGVVMMIKVKNATNYLSSLPDGAKIFK